MSHKFDGQPALIVSAPADEAAAQVASYLVGRFANLSVIVRGKDVLTDGGYYGMVAELGREAALGFLAGVCK